MHSIIYVLSEDIMKKLNNDVPTHFNNTPALYSLYGVDDFGNKISGGLMSHEQFIVRYNFYNNLPLDNK